MSGPTILVLARDPRRAKSRLSPPLRPAERSALARAMIADVVAVAGRLRPKARVVVVTDSPAIRSAVPGTEVLVVAARGTGASARAALAHPWLDTAESALVLPADVPCVRRVDLERVIAAGRADGIVIVPDRHRIGTNALLLRPPRIARPRFGPRSFAAHRALEGRVATRVVTAAGLGLDIDTPADLALLRRRPGRAGPRTRAVLAALASREAPATRRGSPSPRGGRGRPPPAPRR